MALLGCLLFTVYRVKSVAEPAPEEDGAILREAGFSDVQMFQTGLRFEGGASG